jgi:hypothetical protein
MVRCHIQSREYLKLLVISLTLAPPSIAQTPTQGSSASAVSIEAFLNQTNIDTVAASNPIIYRLALVKSVTLKKPEFLPLETDVKSRPFHQIANPADLQLTFKLNKAEKLLTEDPKDIKYFDEFKKIAGVNAFIVFDPARSKIATVEMVTNNQVTTILEAPVETPTPNWDQWLWTNLGFDAYVLDTKGDVIFIGGNLAAFEGRKLQPVIVGPAVGATMKIGADKDVLAISKVVEHRGNFATLQVVIGKKDAKSIPKGSRVIINGKQ